MAIFRKQVFFTEKQQREIVEAIRAAERLTSGEVRLYVEHRCRFMDPLHRAHEVFTKLELHKRMHRNAVLVYVALKDRQYAILGDEGIHTRVGDTFWKTQAEHLKNHFRQGMITEGIVHCILEIGKALQAYFPHTGEQGNNQDEEIFYGK